MPRAFDRLTPIADFDPTHNLEFDPGRFAVQLGDVWKLIWQALTEGIDNAFKGLLRALLPNGVPIDEIGFDDLIVMLETFVTGITDALENIPIIGDIIEAITGIEDGDLEDLGTFFLNVRTFLAGINFLDPDFNLEDAAQAFVNLIVKPFLDLLGNIGDGINHFLGSIFGGIDFTELPTPEAVWSGVVSTFIEPIINVFQQIADGLSSLLGPIFGGIDFGDLPTPEEIWGGIVNLFMLPLNLLLGPNSALDAFNLFGQIPQNLFGFIPASAIGQGNPNLLSNPGFNGSVSMDGGGVWTWDNTTGRTSTGAAKTTANGTQKALLSNAIDVAPNQVLSPTAWVKSSGYVGTGTPIRLTVRTYLDGAAVSTTTIASSAGPGSTWAQLSGSYTVPASGVNQVRLRLVVDTTATGGDIWFDDATLTKGGNGPFDGILDMFGLGSLGDLLSLDPSDAWSTIITTIMNPLSVLEDSGARSLAGALDSALDELTTIFDGSPLENPVAAIAEKVKGWWDTFFNGGPKNVVTQNQVATPSGIPPLDSEEKMPWAYLPPELMTVALGMPWVNAPKSGSNQSITASTDTLLTSWGTQDGPTSLTFTSNKFTLPFDGMWHFEIFVRWSSAPTTGVLSINLKQNDVQIREDITYGVGINRISFPYPAATTDVFGVYAKTAVGSMSITTADTWIRATYLGQTTVPSLPPPNPPVTFGATGGSAHGGGSISWSHTFTADDTAVVVPISHEGPVTPVVTISGGGGTVPILSGPTYIGNYFGANARSSFAAGLLPPGVAGTTRTITVAFGSGGDSAAASANSLSFKGVVSLGVVKVNSGSSAPNISVPSNVSSMVVCQFAGMDVNFSSFNRTQTNIWSFSAFDTWAHVMGYAVGGSNFTATGGKWAGKAIELSNH
ncbi:hypothetical protein [Mycolicibacterium septicum]|uniref:hypothetical protein n=1 Tax=Mycolicibacterium septicum TaxID=98668 RepID=UPI001AF666B2|nr:hypothetical protein [Mycolicibacterium septicum]QRY51724.1 hypothetical protein JVX95_30845 [Mycolicibacterium septicum]